jgi:hypothetical protein
VVDGVVEAGYPRDIGRLVSMFLPTLAEEVLRHFGKLTIPQISCCRLDESNYPAFERGVDREGWFVDLARHVGGRLAGIANLQLPNFPKIAEYYREQRSLAEESVASMMSILKEGLWSRSGEYPRFLSGILTEHGPALLIQIGFDLITVQFPLTTSLCHHLASFETQLLALLGSLCRMHPDLTSLKRAHDLGLRQLGLTPGRLYIALRKLIRGKAEYVETRNPGVFHQSHGKGVLHQQLSAEISTMWSRSDSVSRDNLFAHLDNLLTFSNEIERLV